MKTLEEIKKETEQKHSALFEQCGLFFAFSNQQFEEGRTPLKEGDKYLSIGAGGYMPKSNFPIFEAGMKRISAEQKSEIKAVKGMKEKHILSVLQDHECFYTYSIEDALPQLTMYPKALIVKVFNSNYEKCKQF